MGNVLRAIPFHDCARYVLNAADSECSSDCCGSPCDCKLATHEVDDDLSHVEERQHDVVCGGDEYVHGTTLPAP